MMRMVKTLGRKKKTPSHDLLRPPLLFSFHLQATTSRASPAAVIPARVAVLGASGYTGEEVVRLAAGHSGLDLVALTGDSQAGKPYAEVYPHLEAVTRGLAPLTKIDDVDWNSVDAAFCCLPHATTQETLAKLPKNVKIVDLSADFRLRNVETYKEW